MKTAIVNMVKQRGTDVSFVELLQIPGFEGEEAIGRPEYNIAFWVGVSHAACWAVHDLVAEGIIEIDPTKIETYITDGRTLRLPLAKSPRKYKHPRWMPVVINKGPNFSRLA